MAEYNSNQESQENNNLSPNSFPLYTHTYSNGAVKRKRIKYYLVDKPLSHPFPLVSGQDESSLSIGF